MENSERISHKIYSKYSFDYLRKKLLLLGIDDKELLIKFLNIRLLSTIVIFIFILYTINLGYVIGPIVCSLYYYFLPNIVLDYRIKKRKEKLEKEGMFFFEILSLSIESGNNLHNALILATDNIDSELSNEFKKVLEEVRIGKSLEESLDKMKERIPSDIINNIILNIKESLCFGNNIVDTLNNQIDYLREKKILETKAVISKMPLKISVVSVVFFIPLLLLLILGPLLVNYLN